MFANIGSEDLDTWRRHPVTESLMNELRLRISIHQRAIADRMQASADHDVWLLRVMAGQLKGVQEVANLIMSPGKEENE